MRRTLIVIVSLMAAGCAGAVSDPAAPTPAFVPTIATAPLYVNGQLVCGGNASAWLNCQGQPIPLH